jgi:phenylacetate-coenzyme A ligase PaaK-like adenylate-forming protein
MNDESQELSKRMPSPAGLMEYVTKFVPHYRQIGIKDIRVLPPTSKADIIKKLPEYISDEYRHVRQQLSNLILDRESAGDVSNNQLKPIPGIILEQTTGTTGIPARFPKTVAERTRLALGIWKHRRHVDPLASLRSFLPFVHLPFGRKEDRRIEHDPDPNHIRSVYTDAQRQQIRWLHAQPRLVCRHIKVFNESGFERMPGFLRVCETTGEWLSDPERKTISEYFDCKVINQYGCIETWALGYDDFGTGDVDILTDNVFVELLHPTSLSPISQPGEIGNVAITSLHLRLMPIVRYLNGDRAEWTSVNGRITLRLHEDRQSNMMLLNGNLVPGAGAMRVLLNIAFIRFGYLHLEYIQFIQTAEFSITVKIGACEKGRGLFDELRRVASQGEFSNTPIELIFEELTAERLAVEMKAKKALFISRPAPRPS